MPYNCLRNAYQKPSFVQGLSMAPLRHPWGPAKAFGHEHKRNDSSLFPFFFSSLLSLFLFSLCDVLPGFVARFALLYTSCVFCWSLCSISFVSWFSLFCYFFFSMSGIPRGIDQIETLVWILSGTMSITFRRTRRRTYIRMALNMSSKRRRIRGALEMP